MKTTDVLTPDILKPYQNDLITHLYEHDGTLVRLGMGGGKTVCTATAAAELIADGVMSRVLVVAPLRVAQLVWKQDCARWSHLIELPVHRCLGTPKQRSQAIYDWEQHGGLMTINVENAPWLFQALDVVEFSDGIVFDEITRWKNATGKRLKAIRKDVAKINWRVGLTGSIRPHHVQDVFAPMTLITNERPLGKNITAFRKEFCIPDEYVQNRWHAAAGSEKRVAKLISPWVYDVPESEYAAQLPPLHIVRVPVELPKKAKEAYTRMLYDYMYEDIEAATAAVKVSKLQQITSGFLYDEDGQTKWLHDAKLDALAGLIDDHNSPVLVSYKFKAELKKICERFNCPYIGSGVDRDTADELVSQWNKGEIPILAVHPASVGHGLNMQDGAWKIIWYSGSYSHEEHEQLIARLRRRGQSNDHVVSMHLIAAEIDQVILDTALGNGVLQDNFVSYLSSV